MKIFVKYLAIAVLICSAIDFSVCDSFQEENFVQCAGVNGKYLRKGWKLLKSCSNKKPSITPDGRSIRSIFYSCKSSQNHAVETLVRGINDVRSQDEVLPKISEYLSKTKPNENGEKIINCVKVEANKAKIYLCEQGENALKKEKVIKIATETINLAEYDMRAMQENFCTGNDGIEYVEFIIPKRPQYVLDGQYDGRLYECMVFNVPKDIDGNWERFRAYLIAFIKDLMNRPYQLWNEYKFRQGLAELNIDERDVTEMERYTFAYIKKSDNDTTEYLQTKTA